MSQCEECLGEGRVITEVGVPDWTHGGYIREDLVECPGCGGSGEVKDWGDEDV
jgi:hypothetical protein